MVLLNVPAEAAGDFAFSFGAWKVAGFSYSEILIMADQRMSRPDEVGTLDRVMAG